MAGGEGASKLANAYYNRDETNAMHMTIQSANEE